MLLAARKGDAFTCPSHGGGTIQGPCCQHVQVGGSDAARVGDCGTCGSSGNFDSIKIGNPTVLIAGEAAAGMMHSMAHGGMIGTGCPSVYIGHPIVDASGNLVPIPPECAFMWRRYQPWPGPLDRFRSKADVQYTGTHSPRYMAPQPWGEPRHIQSDTVVVTIRGHRITMYRPTNWRSIPGFPSLDDQNEVLAALSALSDEQLAAIQEVYFNPIANPDDEGWKVWYDNPHHVSAAATGSGRINIFPAARGSGQKGWDALLQHEAAHAVWHNRPDIHAEWNQAIAADRRTVTLYGNKAATEDFAEAVVMYAMVKGTPCEAAMRAAFPARFAILEKVFPKGYAKP